MSAQDFDLLDPAFIRDPYPTYRMLRDEAPIVYRPDWKLWLVSRYEDVSTLLRDRRLGRSILHVMRPGGARLARPTRKRWSRSSPSTGDA